MTDRKLIVIDAVLLVLVIIFGGIGFAKISQQQPAQAPAVDDALVQKAHQYVDSYRAENQLPVQVDSGTTLLGVMAEANVIRYIYNISGYDLSRFSDQLLHDSLVSTVCSDPSIQSILADGVIIQHIYQSATSPTQVSALLTASDCQIGPRTAPHDI